jgi:hypothetical protein
VSASHLVADSLVIARRNLEHVRQIPEKLLDVTLQPIMFTLLHLRPVRAPGPSVRSSYCAI